MEVLALPLLVQTFVQGAQVSTSAEERTRKSDLHFLSSVFANISVVRLPVHAVVCHRSV